VTTRAKANTVLLQPNNGRSLVTDLCEAGRDARTRPVAAGLVEAGSHGVASPSLIAAGLQAPAYELKFFLTEAQAAKVESRARGDMILDPYADPITGDYRTTSIYCDTPRYDIFHSRGVGRQRKHRVRRYGRGPWVYLERKTKWGDRVKKVRSPIPDSQLPMLALPMSLQTWPGDWFHRHLARRQLAPVCRLTYDRVALIGESTGGSCRLTFDRRIRGAVTNDWALDECDGGLPILTDGVICEFKFHSYLPTLFREIVREMRLTPSRVSKFRAFLRASGHVGDGPAVDA